MAFDETLAARIRDALARRRNVEEKKMFGCVCFFLHGNVLAGVWKDRSSPASAPTRGRRHCGSRTSGCSTSPAGR